MIRGLVAALCAVLCACGGKPAATTPKPVPVPVAPKPAGATTWDQLKGSIRQVEISTSDAGLRTALGALFDPEVGQKLDRVRLRGRLARAMAVRGVADVAVRGVQLDAGIKLIVDATSQPKIRKLDARETGGKVILLTATSSDAFGQLDPARVDAVAAAERERYRQRGYVQAEASWSTKPAGQGEVDVTIEVTPGEALVIGTVGFRGNKAVPAAELGKLVAQFLVTGQPLLAERVERAELEIQAFYWDRGFINSKIHSPMLPETSGRADLVFRIEESDRFKIGEVAVTGPPAADHARYLKLFGVKKGDVFNRSAVRDGVQRVTDAAKTAGITSTDVQPSTKVDLPKKTIDLTLEIAPKSNL